MKSCGGVGKGREVVCTNTEPLKVICLPFMLFFSKSLPVCQIRLESYFLVFRTPFHCSVAISLGIKACGTGTGWISDHL